MAEEMHERVLEQGFHGVGLPPPSGDRALEVRVPDHRQGGVRVRRGFGARLDEARNVDDVGRAQADFRRR